MVRRRVPLSRSIWTAELGLTFEVFHTQPRVPGCIPRATIPGHAQNEKCFASHWEIAILICNGTRGLWRPKKRREGRHCVPQAAKHTLSACRCSPFQPLPFPLGFSYGLLPRATFCLHLYTDSEVHTCMQVRSFAQTARKSGWAAVQPSVDFGAQESRVDVQRRKLPGRVDSVVPSCENRASDARSGCDSVVAIWGENNVQSMIYRYTQWSENTDGEMTTCFYWNWAKPCLKDIANSCTCRFTSSYVLRWDIVIKVPLCLESRPSKGSSSKPGVGQNVVSRASPTAGKSTFLISTFLMIQLHLSPDLF